MGTSLDCAPESSDLLGRLVSPARNRYYYSKLLDAEHLELEQAYGNIKRWMLNRLTLGSGVLCGLEVVLTGDKLKARVQSGVAIDGLGREIIVPMLSIAVDPTQPTDSCGNAAGDPVRSGDVTLYLCYLECQAEPATVMVSSCDDDRHCENGLIRERYRLRIGAGPSRPRGLSDKDCNRIFGGPGGIARRSALCEVIDATCAPPEEICVPLATLTLDENGMITNVDQCLSRRTVYSNAVLLELILCLSERVDRCCGEEPPGTRTLALELVSGDGQFAPPNTPVKLPLRARVMDGATPVAGENVIFAVTAGGGAIALAGTPTPASVPIISAADGTVTLPIWRLGTSAAQEVTATLVGAVPDTVRFHARARGNETAPPPVIRAIWPKSDSVLSNGDAGIAIDKWRQSPRIELTFSEKMDATQLGAPDPWLRIAEVTRTQTPGAGTVALVRRIRFGYDSPVTVPMSGVAGATEGFKMEINQNAERPMFVVMVRSAAGNINAVASPVRELDADYAGTGLTTAQLDQLWIASAAVGPGQAIMPLALMTALTLGPGSLPSGEGTPGGDFSSAFTF